MMSVLPVTPLDLVSTTEFHSLIGTDARTGSKQQPVVDPATGRDWGTVDFDEELVDEAVASARSALTSGQWRSLSPMERADVLDAVGQGIEEHLDEIAALETLANGKPLAATRAEVKVSSRWWQYNAALLRTLRDETIRSSATKQAQVVHEAIGVVAVITPFNGAFSLGTWKLAAALAAGNSVVIKPPLNSPGSSIILSRIVTAAGVPAGVVNVVQGGLEEGQRLVEHPDVDMVSFTGSTGAAMKIGASVSSRLARFVAEAGGKSAHIVFDDASLEDAVTAVVQGGFSATGQTCVAGSRVLVQKGISAEFTESLRKRVQQLRVGDPADETTHLGPIATSQQFDRIQGMLSQAASEGATVISGGAEPAGLPDGLKSGFWLEPTILKVPANDLQICQQEVFGPVLTLMEFDTEEDAVSVANDTEFGLAVGFWTRDMPRIHRLSRQLEAGTVWVNTYRGMDWQTPFGGFKKSGIGRENGIEGLREFQQIKAVVQDFGSSPDPFGLV